MSSTNYNKSTFGTRFKKHLNKKRNESFWDTSISFGILPFGIPVYVIIFAAIAIIAVLVYFLKRKIHNDRQRQQAWQHEISLKNPNGAPFPITDVSFDADELEEVYKRLNLYKKIAMSVNQDKSKTKRYMDYVDLLGA
jgi:hypothetical protein